MKMSFVHKIFLILLVVWYAFLPSTSQADEEWFWCVDSWRTMPVKTSFFQRFDYYPEMDEVTAEKAKNSEYQLVWLLGWIVVPEAWCDNDFFFCSFNWSNASVPYYLNTIPYIQECKDGTKKEGMMWLRMAMQLCIPSEVEEDDAIEHCFMQLKPQLQLYIDNNPLVGAEPVAPSVAAAAFFLKWEGEEHLLRKPCEMKPNDFSLFQQKESQSPSLVLLGMEKSKEETNPFLPDYSPWTISFEISSSSEQKQYKWLHVSSYAVDQFGLFNTKNFYFFEEGDRKTLTNKIDLTTTALDPRTKSQDILERARREQVKILVFSEPLMIQNGYFGTFATVYDGIYDFPLEYTAD